MHFQEACRVQLQSLHLFRQGRLEPLHDAFLRGVRHGHHVHGHLGPSMCMRHKQTRYPRLFGESLRCSIQ